MFQDAEIETTFGPLTLTATRGTHVHAHGEQTVNRVLLRVSAHLFRHGDGVWRIGREEDQSPYARYQELIARKVEYDGNYNQGDASQSARSKLMAELERAVNDWANFGDGSAQRLLAQADLDQADRDVAAAEAAVEKARKAYAAAQSEAIQAGIRRQQAADAAWDAGIRPEGVAP